MPSVPAPRRSGAELCVLAALLLSACGSDPANTPDPDPDPVPVVPARLPDSAAWVSAPVRTTTEAQAIIAGGEAWLSMAPGTAPDGVTITVRNTAGGAAGVSVPMVGGGFDHLTIPAAAGDTLSVVAHRSNGDSVVGASVVPVRMRPRIVRVDPANHKTDVPLNSRVTVVFSQPLDWSTVPQGLVLFRNGAVVPGAIFPVVVGRDTVAAQFVPDSPFIAGTTYQLKLLSSVRDRNGFPFQEELDLTFGTIGSPPPARDDTPPQISVPSPLNGEVFSPRWLYLSVIATDNYALKKVWWVLEQGPGITAPKVMYVAEYFAYEAVATRYAGSYSPVWGAGQDGLAYGTYVWKAVALDSNDNRTESPPITITVAPPTAGQLLQVLSFSILEIPVTSAPPINWVYGPRLTVQTTAGASNVRIRGVSGLRIPGVIDNSGGCSTWKVPSGRPVSLFGSYYFLDLEVDSENRASGNPASARLYYTDDGGGNYELELTGGAIVPGDWSYPFDLFSGQWQCPKP